MIVQRLPAKRDAWLVFSACIFPLHIWATIVFLYNFPSLILKANIWEIAGVLAYMLVFALLESFFLFIFLVLLSAILPSRLFRERFVYLGSILPILIAFIALSLNTRLVEDQLWIMVPILVAVGLVFIFFYRRSTEDSRQRAFAERLTLLAGLYFVMDLVCFVYLVLGISLS